MATTHGVVMRPARLDELQRRCRTSLFFDCEICEERVRTDGHKHDPEKLAAWTAKHYPPLASIENWLSAVMETYIGQNINECRQRLIADLKAEVENIISDSHPRA